MNILDSIEHIQRGHFSTSNINKTAIISGLFCHKLKPYRQILAKNL